MASTQPTGLGDLCPQGVFTSHLQLRAPISPSPIQDTALELFLSVSAAELQGWRCEAFRPHSVHRTLVRRGIAGEAASKAVAGHSPGGLVGAFSVICDNPCSSSVGQKPWSKCGPGRFLWSETPGRRTEVSLEPTHQLLSASLPDD